MALLCANHAGNGRREDALQSLRPDQSLAARRLSADRGRYAGADRNPENYFAEVEQAAFAPSNIVPGISFSPDKMLQFRIFSYADARRYRLGSPNYNSLPVNRPRCPVHTYNRDGFMRFDGNYGDAANYEPNTFGGPVEDPRFKEPPFKISGDADRYDHREGNDDYTQVSNLFRLMSKEEQQRLFANTARSMAACRTKSSCVGFGSGQRPIPNMAADWRSNWASTDTKLPLLSDRLLINQGLLEIVWMNFQLVAVENPLAQGFAEFSRAQKLGMNWRWEERGGWWMCTASPHFVRGRQYVGVWRSQGPHRTP